jgi:adapter protein MecA 1/2
MKIEKVSENQIRCTLTREDLASRELKISELAYGTEKAKNLFRDMMQQANYEFGFEAEDIPLMIEAIPLNAECIVLIITKVEDPDELDTRFSRFSPSVHEEDDDLEDFEEEFSENSDEVMELFRRLHESRKGTGEEQVRQRTRSRSTKENKNTIRLFHFDSLRPVLTVSELLTGSYKGKSYLYKDEANGKYLLTLFQDSEDQKSFTRVCNTLSEYGTLQKSQASSISYMTEHCTMILCGSALQDLATIS